MFGDRRPILQFLPSAPHTTAAAARDLYKHQSDHIPGPYMCCLPRSTLRGPAWPGLPPCLHAHHSVPLLGLSLNQLAQYYALWFPLGLCLADPFPHSGLGSTAPSPGRPARSSFQALPRCIAALPVPRAFRNGPALGLACLSIIHLPCWMSVPESKEPKGACLAGR